MTAWMEDVEEPAFLRVKELETAAPKRRAEGWLGTGGVCVWMGRKPAFHFLPPLPAQPSAGRSGSGPGW